MSSSTPAVYMARAASRRSAPARRSTSADAHASTDSQIVARSTGVIVHGANLAAGGSMSDFNYAALERTDHRPWPMPDGPWLMTQTWHDLAFLHWPVDHTALRSALPAGLEMDIFEGQAWIGVV